MAKLQNRYTVAAEILKNNDFKNGMTMKKLGEIHGINKKIFYNLLALRALNKKYYDKVANGEQSYNWAYLEAKAEAKYSTTEKEGN